MNNYIVKTFTGKNIDLSRVVSISDAYFIDKMGSGGYYVGFEIHCQLLDAPIKYTRPFEYDEYTHEGGVKVKLINGEFENTSNFLYGENHRRILAVRRLQAQINELIEQWKSIE